MRNLNSVALDSAAVQPLSFFFLNIIYFYFFIFLYLKSTFQELPSGLVVNHKPTVPLLEILAWLCANLHGKLSEGKLALLSMEEVDILFGVKIACKYFVKIKIKKFRKHKWIEMAIKIMRFFQRNWEFDSSSRVLHHLFSFLKKVSKDHHSRVVLTWGMAVFFFKLWTYLFI